MVKGPCIVDLSTQYNRSHHHTNAKNEADDLQQCPFENVTNLQMQQRSVMWANLVARLNDANQQHAYAST